MPEEILSSFAIKRLSILNENGQVDETLMPELSDAQIVRLYELMDLTRTFDTRALNLQREGRLGTYPSVLGQEATQVGSGFALDREDWVFPSFRELGVYIAKGFPLAQIYQYWGGDERGQFSPEGANIFPICISVGTHVPHAAGAAMAAKYRGEKSVMVAYLGDGGTSKGDFYEGLNMAGVFKLPMVCIVQNNQWAISISRKRQTAASSLAQKAVAFGIEGIQVDGNDVFAVYEATRQALDRARRGQGPTLIECDTYRMADHTTADDALRYRSAEEVEKWKARDPQLRLRRFLEGRGLLSESLQREIDEKNTCMVDEAVRAYEMIESAEPKDIFAYTYASMTPRQVAQLEGFSDAGN